MKKARFIGVLMAAVMATVPFTGTVNNAVNIGFSTIEADAAFQPYNGKVVTKTDPLNVRSGPGTEYKVLYSVPKGTPVAIIDEKNGWGKVSDADGGQWVSLKYIQRISQAEAQKLTDERAKATAKPVYPKSDNPYPATRYDGHTHGQYVFTDYTDANKYMKLYNGEKFLITPDGELIIKPSPKTIKERGGKLYKVTNISVELWYGEKTTRCKACGEIVNTKKYFGEILTLGCGSKYYDERNLSKCDGIVRCSS